MEKKRSREDEEQEVEDDEELLKLIEEDGGEEREIQPLYDTSTVKKLLLEFERANTKNQDARRLHKDPSKWIESELALDEALTNLQALGSSPSLFPVLVQTKSHESLVGLLAHPNVDIGGSVLTLLGELLEGSDDPQEEVYVEALAGELAEADVVGAVVGNWERLRKEGEGGGAMVYSSMVFLEKLIEHDAESGEALLKHPRFLSLAVATLVPSKEEYGDVEVAVSEVLAAAILSGSKEMPTQPREDDMKILEQMLVVLHKKGRSGNVGSALELEVLSNVANACANLLLLPRFLGPFLQCEGVQLMVKLVQSRGCGFMGAMRVLSFATQESVEACEVFVDFGGLKDLFKWFLRDSWPKKVAKKFGWGADELKSLQESLIGILYSCASLLRLDSLQQLRLWHLFLDESGAGVARVGQLWKGFCSNLSRKGLLDFSPLPEDEEEEALLKRLDEGLMQLTQLTLILTWLASVPSPLQDQLRKAVTALEIPFDVVASLLEEHKKGSGNDFLPLLADLKGTVFL